MYKPNHHTGGVLLASLLAGPLLVTSALLASFYLATPQAIPLNLGDLGIILTILFFSLALGMPIGLIINGLGTIIMINLADRFAWARSAVGWTCVGAFVGLSLAIFVAFELGKDGGATEFGLVVTSATCAWLCQCHVDWREV